MNMNQADKKLANYMKQANKDPSYWWMIKNDRPYRRFFIVTLTIMILGGLFLFVVY